MALGNGFTSQGQTVLLTELGMEINHFLLSETKDCNAFQISSYGGKGNQKEPSLGGFRASATGLLKAVISLTSQLV